MKIIINVADNYSPVDKDLLVFNAKTKMWETANLNSTLVSQNKKIAILEQEMTALNQHFADIEDKFDDTLEILKEHLEND
jgi:cell division protein FtsB